MAEFKLILPGDPAPTFVQRTPATPRYTFDTAAGRYLVLHVFHNAARPAARAAFEAVRARRDLFNDDFASYFGVSTNPTDEQANRVRNAVPGYRFFWDFDHQISDLYGARAAEGDLRPLWVVIDPTMRVIGVRSSSEDGTDAAAVIRLLDNQPPPDRFAGFELQAPILVLPRVFEPDFCRTLIDVYDKQGGELSGFMRQIDGKTVGILDEKVKVRRDVTIEDDRLVRGIRARFLRRVVPEIQKVHQYNATRMERYIVSCYAAEEGGHFEAHRDNTTSGTAHRRFAVSVNLNDDFDGGQVCFPEYGPRGFKAPAGGAVVFSCSLLHKVYPVTRGKRYAFLPFLYDDAAAEIRARNADSIVQPETVEPEAAPAEPDPVSPSA